MKTPKPQPTSYKDFLNQMASVKTGKGSKSTKCTENKKTYNNSYCSSLQSMQTPHSQSTSTLDKRSPSQKRLRTLHVDNSDKKSHNRSHNQSQGEGKVAREMKKKDNGICYQRFVTECTDIFMGLFNCSYQEILTFKLPYIQYL